MLVDPEAMRILKDTMKLTLCDDNTESHMILKEGTCLQNLYQWSIHDIWLTKLTIIEDHLFIRPFNKEEKFPN